jgi:phospholipase D1/2
MEARIPSIAQPGGNCWRVEPASRIAFLVDGENYYRAVAEAFARAERSIYIVGWDVNSRTRMIERDNPFGLPSELGPMLDALVSRRRRLHARVLEWDFPMLYALDRELLPLVQFGWRTHRRVHIRLDSNHPLGGSQHQKIVAIDDKIAFVGGMDISHGRWDTCDHAPHDPRRIDPWGRRYPPYHDLMLVCDGRAAAALAALARERWARAGGRRRKAVRTAGDPWPASVKPDLEQAELAIARTEPTYADRPAVTENARAWIDMIRSARRSIYIENQYLTSAAVGDALAERLASDDCPEIVIVLTHASSGWLEEATMGVLRARLLERLRAADRCARLRVYFVCAGNGVDVKIHAKGAIIDDEILRIGSANLNNRSMGLDSECDVFIEAQGRSEVKSAIVALRDRLIGEHLAIAPDRIHAEIEKRGSIGAAIEALRGGEHTLVPLDAERDTWIDTVIPDSALLDPEHPVGMRDLIAELAPEDPVAVLRGPLEHAAIVLAGAAGVAAIWYATPLPERIATFGVDAWLTPWRDSPIAPLVASAIVAAGAVAMAPVTLLGALCGFVLGPWIGAAAALLGALGGALAGYAIGASLRRNTVRRWAGRHVDPVVRQLRIGGLGAMLAARLLPAAPFGAVNVVAGATRFALRPFAIGTACTLAPGMFAMAVLGHLAARAIGSYGSSTLAGATAIAFALIAAMLGVRRHLRVRAQGSDGGAPA